MKKKIVMFAIALVLSIACTVCLAACDDGSDNEPAEIGFVSGTGGTLEGETMLLEVGTTVETVDLTQVIYTKGSASYNVCESDDGTLPVPDKKLKLKNGDNTFYVIADLDGNKVTYTLNVWKNFYASIYYYVDDTIFHSERVLSHSYLDDLQAPDAQYLIYGQQFVSWNCEGYYVEDPIVNIYAQLVYQQCTFTLNTNGGICEKNTAIIERGKNFVLPVPTKEGHRFLGWKHNGKSITSIGSGESIGVWKDEGDIEVVAEWRTNSYRIQMISDGSSAGIVTSDGGIRNIEYGTEYTVSAKTSKLGYEFAGWFDGEKCVSENQLFTFTVGAQDKTYVARWKVSDKLAGFEFTSNAQTCVITGVKDKTTKEVTIPSFVTAIKTNAFDGCENIEKANTPIKFVPNIPKIHLTSVAITDGDRVLTDTFDGCENLKFIYLGSSVTSFDGLAFINLPSLEAINIAEDSVYGSQNGILYVHDFRSILHVPKKVRGNIVIPNTIGAIDASMFSGNKNITSIKLPNELSVIPEECFAGCVNLTEIVIPEAVRIIGANAFKDTAWLKAQPNGMIYINNIAYKFKGIATEDASLTLRDGTKTVAEQAFVNCELREIIVPNSVDTIANGAFINCNTVESLTLPFVGGTRDEWLVAWFSYIFGSGAVPSSLKRVVITGGTVLKEDAFAGCGSIETLVIPDTVNNIYSGALAGCTALETLAIPFVGTSADSTQYNFLGYVFGASSYYENYSNVPKSLRTVNVTGSKIGNYAFYDCLGIENINMLGDVIQIGNSAFGVCSELKSITVGGDNYVVKDNILYDNIQKTIVCVPNRIEGDITILDGVTKIKAYTFNDLGITAITVPNSVTEIEERAFVRCSALNSVRIGDGVGTLRTIAFENCPNIETLHIGSGVSAGVKELISSSNNLKNIEISQDNPYYAYENEILYDLVNNAIIYVSNCIAGDVKIRDGVTELGYGVFLRKNAITSMELPPSLKLIGRNVFYECKGLRSVVMRGVTEIDNYAFEYCSALETVELSDELESIGSGAFAYCEKLESITIPNSVTQIGDTAFALCKIKEVHVSSLENYLNITFGFCGSPFDNSTETKLFVNSQLITDLVIPTSVTELKAWTFYDYTLLQSVSVHAGVEKINWKAFSDCRNIKEVNVDENNANFSNVGGIIYNKEQTKILFVPPRLSGEVMICEGVTAIGNAFDFCDITKITIPRGVVEIYDRAFNYCFKLACIEVDENNAHYASQDGILYNKDKTEILNAPEQLKGTVVLSDRLTSIASNTFDLCSKIEKIVIPISVETIESKAFNNCLKMTICCEAEAQPENWETGSGNKGEEGYIAPWHGDCDLTIIWGYKEEVTN